MVFGSSERSNLFLLQKIGLLPSDMHHHPLDGVWGILGMNERIVTNYRIPISGRNQEFTRIYTSLNAIPENSVWLGSTKSLNNHILGQRFICLAYWPPMAVPAEPQS